MSSILKRFADRLHYLRKEKGLTQEVLANRAKLAPGFISELERARKIPSLITLDRLAHGLQIDVSQLVDFTSATESDGDREKDEKMMLIEIIRGLSHADARRVRKIVQGLLDS